MLNRINKEGRFKLLDRDITKEEVDTILYNLGKRIDCIDIKDSEFHIKYHNRHKNQRYDERAGYLNVFISVYNSVFDLKATNITYADIKNLIAETAERTTSEDYYCFAYREGVNNALYSIQSMIHGVIKLSKENKNEK